MGEIKKILSITGLLIFSFLGESFAQESGFSEAQQANLIASLQNYEPFESEVTRTTHQTYSNVEQLCPKVPYPDDKFCLEKKYINEDNYIVTVTFEKLEQFSEEPHAPLIKGVMPFKRDTTNRDIYLAKVSDTVFREYIGDDYHRFGEVDLVMINQENVVIELEVKEAIELQEVLQNPYINYVEHIGKPRARLEEITN